jgi:hypothetical protein
MIESLTKEQTDKFPFYVKKWIDIGLSTSEINEERAVKAINLVYNRGGIEEPKKIYFVKSPMAMFILIEMLNSINSNNVPNSVNSFSDSLKRNIRDYMLKSVYGCHEAGWLSYFDFFRNEFPEKFQLKQLDGLMEAAKEVGWFFPSKEICIVSEKPNSICLDDRNRIHNPAGAAISYRDGFSIYAINGVRVPKYVIEQPELITVDKIKNQKNVEIRRVMLDKYDIKKYIEDCGAKLIHKDLDKLGNSVELYKEELEGDEPIMMVKVINSTPEPDGTSKVYFLRVPHTEEVDKTGVLKGEMCDAIQAQAWTFGKTKEQFEKMSIQT